VLGEDEVKGDVGRATVDGRVKALPKSQSKFAWSPDRIAHELICKMDQFTHRREDHMRKLLWTFGTDPYFESGARGGNAIECTPKNFGRMCSRFGLVCKEDEAEEIFAKHKLPKEGCNMYTLATKFLDSQTDTAALVRQTHKSVLIRSGQQQQRTHDPFKLARMPGDAWKAYTVTPPYATDSPAPAAGAGSSRDPLPPIPSAKE